MHFTRNLLSSTNSSTYTIILPNTKPQILKKCIALLQTCKSLPHLTQIHAHSIRNGVSLSNPHFGKYLIFFTISLSTNPMPYASSIFSQIDTPNVFTLNTMIRGHAESSNPIHALHVYYQHVMSSFVPPDTHTYPFLLKACAKLLDLEEGEKVHGLSVKNGHQGSVFVQNALVHLYGSCGLCQSAYKVFEIMDVRNLVTWNSVINGFAVNGRPNEALTLFREMTVEPDGFTVVNVLCACVELGALALGRRVHVYVLKTMMDENLHVNNALIDLYGKCGSINDAYEVFDEMVCRSVVSWTSLIVGLSLNGHGKEAIEMFVAMEEEGLVPTEITFVGVLYACSHCGWVNDGFDYFNKMKKIYKIIPRIEHYGCMVDLLGRAGMVEEAFKFIIKMPLAPNAIVWRALLGACSIHKKMVIGSIAWAQLERLDPGHSGDYVLMSNLYASDRQWANVQQIRRRMVSGGVKKTPGHSLVELRNEVHEFVMGDRSHPETDEIYRMLDDVALRLRQEGYTARIKNVLADIEDEEKEDALMYHSERLAIAYALLRTAPGVPIRIVKNLRVCEDCHVVIKLISKVYGREIVVRDRSRFHHFRDGYCSCKDYW